MGGVEKQVFQSRLGRVVGVKGLGLGGDLGGLQGSGVDLGPHGGPNRCLKSHKVENNS